MFEYTGCDGVAVGRGALGNPWIFNEIRAALNGGTYSPPDTVTRLGTAKQHIKRLIADKGARVGTLEARKHISWYLHGIEGAPAYRVRIMQTRTY